MTGVGGKVVIVTGAASGQGAAEAKLFAAEGAKVVVADINDTGRDVAAGLGALFVRHDVSEKTSWAELISSTLDRYGRLDVLVNNAAVYKPATFLNTDDELWDLHYRVNQRGVFLGMRAAVDAMLRTGGGSIVNIVSISAMSSYPGQFAYGTSKWALRGLTTLAATELAPLGIRVNGVYPGMIDTPMTRQNTPEHNKTMAEMIPMRRFGTPEEVARLVVFLASDDASYIAGAEVKIGGGAS